jgi:hypothetical protein
LCGLHIDNSFKNIQLIGKKMPNIKENSFSFDCNAKESIQDRLKYLFKGRSMRQASIDWGLPYSTLNNYFAKGATPGLDVVIRISAYEGVSIGWLATGESDWGTGMKGDNFKTLDATESTKLSISSKEDLMKIFQSTSLNQKMHCH